MRNAVKMVKLIAIFTVLANLFGCKMPEPHMLDGPGMEYVDSAYRTEYANTLPFDEIEEYPYCAAAYLGKGEEDMEKGHQILHRHQPLWQFYLRRSNPKTGLGFGRADRP